MKKHFFSVALTLSVAVLMMASCGKSPYPGYKKSDNGLYYKFLTENVEKQGETPKEGDVVYMDFAYYINDSLLFERHNDGFYDIMRPSAFKGDLYEGLSMMHVGDSLSMIMPADSVFYKMFRAQELPKFVTPGSILRFEVKVNELLSQEEHEARLKAEREAKTQESRDILAKYLQDNGIEAQPTESGLVYVCEKAKKGLKPQNGQRVKVHYTGKLLDGTVFDSSVERGEPFEFALGAGQVIKGWDEGIALMSKGEKGVLYIPSDLAYGPMGAGGMIPPYANLIFEVELIDFE